jgi:enamine deaminase RidA (YjgF/YER057c/UK114 family)
MKRAKVIWSVLLALILLVGIGLAGCASIQESWDRLTPDQKARVIVNDLQQQLDQAFDTSKAYVALHPEYQATWQNEVVPAFDVANEAMKNVITLAQNGDITPDEVYEQIQPLLNKILALLASIGAPVE